MAFKLLSNTFLIACIALVAMTATTVIARSDSFQLTVIPEDIEMLFTENVQLVCTGNGGNQDDTNIDSNSNTNDSGSSSMTMVEVSRIRIVRLNHDGMWNTLATMSHDNDKVVEDPNASVTGALGKPEDSYFKVIWPLASDALRGKYRCDVVGKDVNGDFVTEITDPVLVQDSKKSVADVLAVLQEQRERAKMKFDSIKQMLLEASQRSSQIETDKVQHHFKEQDTRLEKMESKIDELLSLYRLEKTPACQMDNFTVDFEDDIWPYGIFGLLMPESGCPAHTSHKWFTGTRQHLTSGHSRVPSYSHMARPITSGAFFHQRFCIINNTESTRAWPKGTYCINRKKGYCPGGFEPGFMRYDDKHSGSSRSGVLPDGYYSSYTRIYYCCRHDAPPTTPIVLPTYQPFYLYRYRGKCQHVMGMKITHEYFVVDTTFDDNGDSYSSRVHPDGKLNPVRVELCYYESETIQS